MSADTHGYVIATPVRFDQSLRLVGDEDCGVDLACRLCDCVGGLPIAYYASHPDEQAYRGTDVQVVHTITALLSAGQAHLVAAHPE